MSDSIVFFDLPSKDENPRCFSPNAWKTRAVLNFKDLSYTTEWTDFPDIAPKFKSFGMVPNDHSECIFEYSCPAIRLPNGSYAMESRSVAKALEALKPEPSLHLDSGYPERAQGCIDQLLVSLSIPYMYRIPDMLLPQRGAEWYHIERPKLFPGDVTLYDLARHPDLAGEKAWQNSEPGMNAVKQLLHENPEGPYVMGKEVSFADFILAGFWQFLGKIDEGGDLHGRMMQFDPSFHAHEKACEQWFKRDDH